MDNNGRISIYEDTIGGYKDYFSNKKVEPKGKMLFNTAIDIEEPAELDKLTEDARLIVFKAIRQNDEYLANFIIDKYKTYKEEQLFADSIDAIEPEKHIDFCKLCGGSGVITNEFGVEEVCSCKSITFKPKAKSKIAKVDDRANDKFISRVKMITKSERVDTEYKYEKVIADIKKDASNGEYTLIGHALFNKTIKKIINTIKTGNMEKLNSYILGAPLNFGQEEFIDQCLISLIKQNKKVVPYISLSRLAEVKLDASERMLKMIRTGDTSKREKGFSWTDYTDSAVVFVRLDDFDNAYIEARCLFTLVQERKDRKLPTIVITHHNLYTFTKDIDTRSNFLVDMINYDQENESESKLNYIYTYKKWR